VHQKVFFAEKGYMSIVKADNLKVSYVVVFLAAAALYIATCAPGAVWQDSGMYQYRIWHNDIEGKLGLALSHPLYHIIGIAVKYIPIGEFGYRINLISAIAGAFAVANLFLLLRLWLKDIFAAAMAAVTLALSHTMWWHAVIAEDYTLYTALLLTELIMLLQYVKTKQLIFLYLLGLFNGLAIATHMFASIAFICYLVFLVVLLVKKQIHLKNIGIVAVLWVAGAAPYEYLIIKMYIETGDFAGTLASAMFGNSWQGDVFNTSVSAKLIKENLILIAYNFSTFNGLFFFAGLYGLKKIVPSRSFKNILLALMTGFFVFAFRYTVPDRYTFFMPFYCIGSVIGGAGFNLFITQANRRTLRWIVCFLAVLPIPTYIIAPIVAEKIRYDLPTRKNISYRDDYIWFLRPWRPGYHGPENFAAEVFSKLGPGAVVYADNTMVYSLLYLQEVKGKRKDLKIISGITSSANTTSLCEKPIESWLLEGDVFTVSPVAGYKFKNNGIVWKITR